VALAMLIQPPFDGSGDAGLQNRLPTLQASRLPRRHQFANPQFECFSDRSLCIAK
jgi:hypothetical protein